MQSNPWDLQLKGPQGTSPDGSAVEEAFLPEALDSCCYSEQALLGCLMGTGGPEFNGRAQPLASQKVLETIPSSSVRKMLKRSLENHL